MEKHENGEPVFEPDEQAKQLSEFYTNDPWCIISVCGDYFKKRLSGKITEIQKKLNV